MKIQCAALVVTLAFVGVAGCDSGKPANPGAAFGPGSSPGGGVAHADSTAAAPPVPAPADNPETPEKVALGKMLFFDKRLSKDGSASCETCHVPEQGWTDQKRFSTKVGGAVNTRNTPSLYNVGYQTAWYWDGRAPTLEKQIEAAWKGQMGADPAEIAKKLGAVKGYADEFQKVFGGEASADAILKALGCYVRTITCWQTPWDRFQAGEKDAIPADAQAGFALFTGKAACSQCHTPPLFYDKTFHDAGIGSGAEKPDLGRGAITKDAKDNGKFKTPSLRAVSLTAPYFHDGSAEKLEDAVKTMSDGGVANPNLDPLLAPRGLSNAERAQLVAFLRSLEPKEKIERPTLPQ